MAGTFTKLKRIKARLQGGAEAAVAVPYELKCECGATVSGMRRKTWIESECPECYQSLFVLAANVYPSTKSVPSDVLSGSLSDRLKTVIGELFPKKKKKKKKSKKAAEKSTSADAAATAVEVPRRSPFRMPRIDVIGFLKRTFTPFRLLMMAMMGVIGFTIYWMTYQRAIESARQTWLKSPEVIEQQLENSELVDLQKTLEDAVAAADVLQRNDPESRRVRNLLDETIAINTIAANDLLTGFHEAYKDTTLTEDALHQVELVCRSGTFVFDSYVQAKPGLSEVFLVDFPATPGRHPVEIIIPLPAVTDFREFIEDGRAVFAARIKSVVAPERGTYNPWVLTVEPASFVLMTSVQHCAYIGFTEADDPTLKDVLQRQLEFVEGSATWQNRAATAVIEADEDTKKD